MDESQYTPSDSLNAVGSAGAIADVQDETQHDIQDACDALAALILSRCADAGLKIAAAESLTGGLLADAFVRIPGASAVFLGSAVTYDIRAKRSILGVDGTLLEREGAVHPDVARAMASGTARLYTQDGDDGTVIGLSTTGVAGPGPDGDKPAGLVYIGIAMPTGRPVDGGTQSDDAHPGECAPRRTGIDAKALELHLHGTREEVRRLTVLRMLEALASQLGA